MGKLVILLQFEAIKKLNVKKRIYSLIFYFIMNVYKTDLL